MIVDDDFKEMPRGQTGEIVVRPKRPNVMFEGYWGRPQETLDVFGGMLFHTGDIGMFDDHDFFYFVDRKRIICGAEARTFPAMRWRPPSLYILR